MNTAAATTNISTRYATGVGFDAAMMCALLIAVYTIEKTDRGVVIEGSSPDGRCTGTCDRCGMAISNIYVFRDRANTTTMHVGEDCAEKMGVSAEGLADARRAMRAHKWEVKTREERAAARVAAASAKERAEQERAENLTAHSEWIAELSRLDIDPNATAWERDQVGRIVSKIAAQGAEWISDPQSDSEDELAHRFWSIRTRLAMCSTSKAVSAKAVTATFRRYRDPIALEPFAYGRGCTYINFLCDDEGQAYVWKSSNCVGRGETIRGTFSVVGSDARDGLTSTNINRPRKATLTTADGWERGF